MAAPILWAPGIFWFFLLENPHAHKIPPFRGGGGVLGFFRRGGGGSANFIFMGVGIFPFLPSGSIQERRDRTDPSPLCYASMDPKPRLFAISLLFSPKQGSPLEVLRENRHSLILCSLCIDFWIKM